MSKVNDLTGKRFGKLTVLRREGSNHRGRATWFCECECGKTSIVLGNALLTVDTRSCGCLEVEYRSNHPLIHGHCHRNSISPEYMIWGAMVQRCTNPNVKNFHNYGGRGITVSESWLRFENFIADMGPRPDKKLTLERKDNNLGYSKENCCWDTRKVQSNNRRGLHIIEFNGRSLNLRQWDNELGFNKGVVIQRIRAGWSVARALTEKLNVRTHGF